jgi:methionine-rich copper-binding protein CopC
MGRAVSATGSHRKRRISVIGATGVAAAVLALLAAAAQPAVMLAHAELISSVPANRAQLDAAPAAVSLVFDRELLPDGTGFVVNDGGGRTVGEGALDLTVPDRNEIRGAVTILGSGTFTVAWTAVAGDGHAESGRLSFTVRASASGAAPDTAIAASKVDPASLTGGLLLVLATAHALRRSRRAQR